MSLLCAAPLFAADTNHYIHLEADEFRGIQLNLQIAVGYPDPVEKHTNWCSRMAIFPDTTQGGPTKILSLDAHAQQARNSCWRDIDVPAAGKYKVWVRYSDWRNKTEFFKVKIEQGGKTKVDHEFGAKSVLSDSDEMKLRVDFAYAWDNAECSLERGPAHITLYTDRVAEADREVDVLILTDDLDYIPRERGVLTPAYGAYLDRWMKDRQPLKPIVPPSNNFTVPDAWKIKKIAGRDFWFTGAQLEGLIPETRSAEFPTNWYMAKTDSPTPPVMSDPNTAIWTRIGSQQWPEFLSSTNHCTRWLKDTKRAFWIESTWPGFHHPKPDIDYLKLFKEIRAIFGEQLLGFYELEGPFLPQNTIPPTSTRDEGFAAAKNFVLTNMAQGAWKVIFGADVGPMTNEYFSTPSFASTFMSPVLFEVGNTFVGNELGDGAMDAPLRQAFNRGAAREYGGKWGSHFGAFAYESGPPNDTETGYGDWLTARKGDIYGTSISVMRRTAYLAWLSGQNVHHFEDIGSIFWKHWHHDDKRSLTPRGEAIAEFLATIRQHDRGVPCTPVAFLMDKAHGWVNWSLTPYRIWNNTLPQEADYAVDQHFESLSWPIRQDEAKVENDEQAMMPHSIIGDTYDVIVTADAHADAVDNYRVVWPVGDTRLNKVWLAKLKKFVEQGGTLVASVEQARGVFDDKFLGAKLTGQRGEDTIAKCALDDETLTSSEFEFEKVEPTTAKVLATSGSGAPLITENSVGKGRVLLTTTRWMMTRDGWAVPLQPHLALHVSSGLLPVTVRGNVEYTINKTAKGWLVGLMNNRGVHKMAHAQAVVRRDEDAEVEILYHGRVHSHLTVQGGDVKLVEIQE